MRRLFGLFVLAAIAGLAAVTFLWWSGGADKATTVTVREGATLTSLCPSLERQGLIRGNCATYRFFAKVLGASDGIQAGEFDVPAGTSGARLLDILQHGQPVQRLITIPEGMPSILVQEKLGANANLTGPAPLMPKWAYGYIHCRERYHSSDEIIANAEEFRTRKIPLDVIVQDWQYWGRYGWNAMAFDEKDYPDPKALTTTLHAKNVRFMRSEEHTSELQSH